MPNFSSLAGLEVTEKFGVGGVGWWVPSEYCVQPNELAFTVALGWVELS